MLVQCVCFVLLIIWFVSLYYWTQTTTMYETPTPLHYAVWWSGSSIIILIESSIQIDPRARRDRFVYRFSCCLLLDYILLNLRICAAKHTFHPISYSAVSCSLCISSWVSLIHLTSHYYNYERTTLHLRYPSTNGRFVGSVHRSANRCYTKSYHITSYCIILYSMSHLSPPPLCTVLCSISKLYLE